MMKNILCHKNNPNSQPLLSEMPQSNDINKLITNHIKKHNQNMSKKRKVNKKTRSSVFVYFSDYTQFINILKAMEESELTDTLNIPHDINREIAEYATGDWIYCGNTECAELVSVLEEYEKFECLGCAGTW